MNKEKASQVLEAILLASRSKVKKENLNKFFLGFNIDFLIKESNEKLKGRGFFIYDDGENIELVTQPNLANYLINFFGFEENKLLKDFLEVLAIIAYGGPISLKRIDNLRGEKSIYLLKELLAEGFIKKESGYYRISNKFLKILGFEKENELPNYYELRKELKKNY